MARILLIDDDRDILVLCQRILLERNHDVIALENGLDALTYLEKHDFDLVISDANMPHLSGFELIKEIKKKKNWDHLGVALFTSRRSKQDVEKALDLGSDDYIVKPLEPSVFVEKVDALLKKKAPHNWAEVTFDEKSLQKEAYLQNSIELVKVSEFGVTFLSSQEFKEGDVVQCSGLLFHELEAEAPDLQVMTCKEEPFKKGTWLVKTHYMGATENFLNKIRYWMNQYFVKRAG